MPTASTTAKHAAQPGQRSPMDLLLIGGDPCGIGTRTASLVLNPRTAESPAEAETKTSRMSITTARELELEAALLLVLELGNLAIDPGEAPFGGVISTFIRVPFCVLSAAFRSRVQTAPGAGMGLAAGNFARRPSCDGDKIH